MMRYYENILWDKINIFREKLIFQKERIKIRNAEKLSKDHRKKMYKILKSRSTFSFITKKSYFTLLTKLQANLRVTNHSSSN